MNAKATIRKILFIAVWLCIGGGMLTLLLAAISSKKKGHCSGLSVSIKGPEDNFFITEMEVESLLMKACSGPLRGQPVADLNLNELEEMLERNNWISEAELYFDNQDLLHVRVTEKEPVARLFTTEGNSFYLDAAGRQLPLSEQRNAKVPVFTGLPDKRKYTGEDSILLDQIRSAAIYIQRDSFWMAQVAQIHITPERSMEMVPVVGNHIVKLGSGEQIDTKFRRLLQFYRQVLSKTGFDRYKLIDVQFKGQVVASRFAGDPKVDSVQLRKNVEKLLKYAEESAKDTVVKALPPVTILARDSASLNKEDWPVEKNQNPEKLNDPNPRLDDPPPALRQPADGGQAVKLSGEQGGKEKSGKAKPTAAPEKKRKPKAVMPKKTEKVEETADHGYN